MKQLTFPKHHVVAIGNTLISLDSMGLSCCPSNTIHTDERFLPKILVELGIFPSISEVRKNRKEMMITLDRIDWLTLKFGHRIVDIVVGE